MFNKRYKCAIAVIVTLGMLSFGVPSTKAYFGDRENSSENVFSAGTLDISIGDLGVYSSGLLYPGDSETTIVQVSNAGNLGFQYTASTAVSAGETLACDYITMTVSGPPGYTYTGRIDGFISSATTTVSSDWNFSFLVHPETPPSVWGKTCSFKLSYTAWQDNMSDSSLGFSSLKEKLGQINIGKLVVMNEVLPNPEGDDGQGGLQGEWVELYNNSNVDIDLNGWKIKDAANHTITISPDNTFGGRTLIKAKGSHLEWVVVFMDSAILNNDGDTVSFYSPADDLIDQYTFTDSETDSDSDSHSTGGGDNNNPAGNETAGNEGKSYARIPDGIGEWIDPIPTPGWTNNYSEIPEVKEKLPEEQTQTLSESIASSLSVATSTEFFAATEQASTTPEMIETEPEAIPPESEELAPTEIIESEPVSETETSLEKYSETVVTEMEPAIITEPDEAESEIKEESEEIKEPEKKLVTLPQEEVPIAE